MNFSIRDVTDADTPAIAALASELGYQTDIDAMRDRLAKIRATDTDLAIVAVNGNHEVIGWLQAHAALIIESGFRVEITGLSVSSKSRRSGVGRALVAQAERWARARGAAAVVVRSNVSRVESHLFYPALDYELTKTQHVYRKKLES